jgi:glycine cleavage system transcriptional repressor
MKHSLLISIFCPDKTGLIAAITGKLFELGINLGDTTFAVLGTGAKFTAVCDSPLSASEIENALQALPELRGANVKVSQFDLAATHAPNANITHQFTLMGKDHPGLIARLSEVFVEFEANIVRLHAEKIPAADGEDQYLIQIAAYVPETRVPACLATVSNTASSLQMQCTIIT